MRVGYLGPPGTYSFEVASIYFSHFNNIELIAYETIEDVVAAAEKKEVTIATVPIENSLEGPVLSTLDQLSGVAKKQSQNKESDGTSLTIIGEHYHSVEHCLVANIGATLTNITQVYSHVQAIGQCRTWLSTHLPHASMTTVSSTAKAVQIASSNLSSAAVASSIAAKEYGMQIIQRKIQDSALNQTRFVFISAMPAADYSAATDLFSPERKSSKRTSIYFETAENSQELSNFLKNASSFTILAIHSRPVKGTAWRRSYFIDVEGEVTQENICILGSYPSRSDQRLTET